MKSHTTTFRMRWVLSGICTAAFVSGCAKGKDPPEATPKISIATGTFTMGATDSDPCDTSDIRSGPDIVLGCSATEQSALIRHQVDVKSFCLDAHEVTVLQYHHCVELGDCNKPKSTNAGNENTPGFVEKYYSNRDTYSDYPVLGVAWEDAQQYCASKGGRLPTEIEWEFAATSRGARQNVFENNALVATLKNEDCTGANNEIAFGACSGQNVRAVGTSPQDVTAEGVSDMAANAAEWTADRFDHLAYCAADQNGVDLDSAFFMDATLQRPVYADDGNGTLLPGPLLEDADSTCVTDCNSATSTCQSACATGYAEGQPAQQKARWQRAVCASRTGCQSDTQCPADAEDAECTAFCECLELSADDESGPVKVAEPPADGLSCLKQCNEVFNVCAADDCVRDDASIICIHDGSNNRRPGPWCIGRKDADSKVPVEVPASRVYRQIDGAHVVRGADFQKTAECQLRPTRRTPKVGSSPLIGFRCAYDSCN